MHLILTILINTFAGVGFVLTALFTLGVFISRRRKSNR